VTVSRNPAVKPNPGVHDGVLFTARIENSGLRRETFEKRSFLFKFKEGEKFNHRNTWSISRITI
jgi:hypothetical protein